MPSQIKSLELTFDLKERLREAAYRERISMGEYIRRIVDDYAVGKASPPAKKPHQVKSETIKYVAPESYGDAAALAAKEGVSLSEVIRHQIERRA